MAFPQQGQQGAPEEEMMQEPMPQQQPPMGGGMPQQPMMPQAGGAPPAPMIDGEDLQMLLFSRVAEMNPQEQQTLDALITPETLPVLFKLLPELGILFEQASAIKGMQGEGMEPEEEYEDEEGMDYEEESDNPLINENLSRGLMG